MNKLKAFTLVEMLAVLALAAILSGILAWLIFWFQNRFFEYDKREAISLELFFLDKALRLDMEKAATVLSNASGFEFQDDKKITYSSWSLKDSLPFRKSIGTDTFHVKTNTMTFDSKTHTILFGLSDSGGEIVYPIRRFANCRLTDEKMPF